MALVHRECLLAWIDVKEDALVCELCATPYVSEFHWHSVPAWLHEFVRPFTATFLYHTIWSSCQCKVRLCQCPTLLGWMRNALVIASIVPWFVLVLWGTTTLLSSNAPPLNLGAAAQLGAVLFDLYASARFGHFVLAPRIAVVLPSVKEADVLFATQTLTALV